MSEYDLVVRGGTIVDGTGIPRYNADLAVKDGRVTKISGRIPAGGAREIDASGCIVAPGAIDLHTHYDGQLNWDPYASLSGWFGVTSLTIGQCGFGFAPTRPEDRDLNMRMMNRIEAIPLDSMRKGMRWDWETFPEYLDSLDRQGLGLNVGAVFPFSPLRGYVLGMLPARERTSVTEAELNRMKELFHEAMVAGAFGISSDKSLEDRPEDGGFLPSHVASDEEFIALAEVLGEFGVGHLGWTSGPHTFGDRREQHALLTQMMKRSGRPLHVILGGTEEDSAWVQSMQSEGYPLILQMTAMRFDNEFKLSEYNMFDIMPDWVEPLVGTPDERTAKLRDPAVRAAMKRDVEVTVDNRADFDKMRVLEVAHERNRRYEGMTIIELGEAMTREPLDAFLDLALDEGLETEFIVPIAERSDEEMAVRMKDLHTHVSVSDGGAHIKFSSVAMWPMYFLAHWIRDLEIMSLEEGHYKISALPAWLADFKDRGTLRVGSWADIIVYNQGKLGFVHDKPVFANDFPGGERRLIQKPKGLRYTIVNGTVTFEDGVCTGALPGKLLRSYDS